MKIKALTLAAVIAGLPACAFAQSPLGSSPAAQPAAAGLDATAEALQSAANAAPGPRSVPNRAIPLPVTVSPQVSALVAAPYLPIWNADPKTPAAWHALVDAVAAKGAAKLPALRDSLGVSSEAVVIDGVKAFVLTPREIRPGNENRVLINLHGGGYVLYPGEAGTVEAILMAGFGGYRVIAVDYRMPPDAPYPAAMDDAVTVYKAVLRRTPPRNVAVFGTSTGGGMTLALMLRAKAEGVPLPGAIAPGTPWSDLTETGDSYRANEWLDNVLVSYRGWISRAALLYAAGRDLHDPQLSPIYGDFHGLPPAILTSGTRDLFLSNTVRAHRKLRQAGVDAQLQVFEGLSHAQYLSDAQAPETKEVFTEIAAFFDHHLANDPGLR